MATRRLGRGLDGLLPSAPSASPRAASTALIEQLHPNRDQPRRHFDDEALQELADSIAAHGVLEPILVRNARPPVPDIAFQPASPMPGEAIACQVTPNPDLEGDPISVTTSPCSTWKDTSFTAWMLP